ncbi:MAG: YdcF family protein [Sulfurimonas sp.]|nr:YdcF family protein [Sulfurimonas sp.]
MHELGFLLKKFISFFVEPYGMFLTLLLLGIYFLFIEKYKISKNIFILLFGLMCLFAYQPFSNFLVEGLEKRYSKYNYGEDIKYIHVLGSGHSIDNTQPISSLISDAGIKRVVEGVIIYKHTPNSKLVFTGYKGKTNISNGQMNAKLAIALGVKKDDIIIGDKPKDTKEEAIFMKNILGDKKFVLVTSATHMSRSMQLFIMQGLNPIPAPTDFHKNKTSNYLQLPRLSALRDSQKAIHEYIGKLWVDIRYALRN